MASVSSGVRPPEAGRCPPAEVGLGPAEVGLGPPTVPDPGSFALDSKYRFLVNVGKYCLVWENIVKGGKILVSVGKY